MIQAALLLLLVNLWAGLVWALAAPMARRNAGLGLWPAYWLGAVAAILLPAVLALAAPDGARIALRAAFAGAADAAGAALAPVFPPVAEQPHSPSVVLPGGFVADPAPMQAGPGAGTPRAAQAATAPSIPAPGAAYAVRLPDAGALSFGFVVLYAAGAAFALLRLLMAHLRAWRLLWRGAALALPGARYRVLEAGDSPCALGFPVRRILLPAGLAERVAPDELEMILRHETAHIDRRDPEAMFLLGLVQAALWPNPAVRALIAQWRLAAEAAADAAVAAGQPMALRARYAHLLISALNPGRGALVAAPSAAFRLDHKESAKMRLNAILHARASADARTRLAAAASGAVAVCAAAAISVGLMAPPAEAADTPFPAAARPVTAAPAPVRPATEAPIPQRSVTQRTVAQAPVTEETVAEDSARSVTRAEAAPETRPVQPAPDLVPPARIVIPADISPTAELICVDRQGRVHAQLLGGRGGLETLLGGDEAACAVDRDTALWAMVSGGPAYEAYRTEFEAARAGDALTTGNPALRAAIAGVAGQVLKEGESHLWLPAQIWNAPVDPSGAALGPNTYLVCIDGEGTVYEQLAHPLTPEGAPGFHAGSLSTADWIDAACDAAWEEEMASSGWPPAQEDRPAAPDPERSSALSLQLIRELSAAREIGALAEMAEGVRAPDALVESYRRRIAATMEQAIVALRDPATDPDSRRILAFNWFTLPAGGR